MIAGVTLEQARTYGDTTLSFYAREEDTRAGGEEGDDEVNEGGQR